MPMGISIPWGSVYETACERLKFLYASVAQEGPPLAYVLAALQVDVHHCYLLLGLAGQMEQFIAEHGCGPDDMPYDGQDSAE